MFDILPFFLCPRRHGPPAKLRELLAHHWPAMCSASSRPWVCRRRRSMTSCTGMGLRWSGFEVVAPDLDGVATE